MKNLIAPWLNKYITLLKRVVFSILLLFSIGVFFSISSPSQFYDRTNTHENNWKLTRVSQVQQDIVFASLHGRHLLKEELADEEADGGQECQHSHASTVVTRTRISVVQTHLSLLLLVEHPPLRWDTSEYYYSKQLKDFINNC